MSDLIAFAAAGQRMPANLVLKMQRCVVSEAEFADFRESAIGKRKRHGFVCVAVERDRTWTDPGGIVAKTWFLGLMPKEVRK